MVKLRVEEGQIYDEFSGFHIGSTSDMFLN